MFFRIDLRTTDAAAARAFYASVLGHDRSTIWQLHEQALARGARPHWLGELGAADTEAAVAAFVARGAIQYAPTRAREGGHTAVLRDPGGALLAVGTPPPTAAPNEVVWYVLRTNEVERATAYYRELFGLDFTERVDLGDQGVFRRFAWTAGGPSVGLIGDVRSGIHPQWLFFFEVDALDASIAAVRVGGGAATQPSRGPSGERVCVCDDPQGASFGLREAERAGRRPERSEGHAQSSRDSDIPPR